MLAKQCAYFRLVPSCPSNPRKYTSVSWRNSLIFLKGTYARKGPKQHDPNLYNAVPCQIHHMENCRFLRLSCLFRPPRPLSRRHPPARSRRKCACHRSFNIHLCCLTMLLVPLRPCRFLGIRDPSASGWRHITSGSRTLRCRYRAVSSDQALNCRNCIV
jgi:hypothetical protein